jgi:ribosome-associated translation inhibitor RaiA
MKNYYYDNDFDRAFEEAVDELDRAERKHKEAQAND